MAQRPSKREEEKKATFAEAWSILSSLKKPFQARDEVWPLRRRIRLRQEEPPVPDPYFQSALKHKTSELDYSVRQITSLLQENKEQYVLYAIDDKADARRLADEAREVTSAVMELLEDQHPVERARLLCHDYQCADGVAIEKMHFDYDFYSKVFKTKGTEKDWSDAFFEYVKETRKLPIRKTALDPFTCYWEFDVNGLSAVCEQGRVRKSALRDTYRNDKQIINALARTAASDVGTYGPVGTIGASNTTYDDGADTVDFFEIWTRNHFYMLIEGGKDEQGKPHREVLIAQKHPFKRPPYFFAPGILTGHQDPLHQFQPLVLPLYPLSLELSAVRTARFNAAFLSSFKPFYIEYDKDASVDDEEAGNLKVHFLMPGTEIPSVRGGKIVPIDWTNLDELEKLEQSILDDRARYAFQAILAGNAPAGESTAWATRMLRDQGMVQFNQVLRNFAQMREEEIRFIYFLVSDVLKEDMPVARRIFDKKSGKGHIAMHSLTVEMATANFDIEVRLSAGKASDRIAIVEEFRRARQAGEVPLRYVLEQGWGFDNATEIMDETTDEMMRQQMLPMLMQVAIQLATQGAQQTLQGQLPQNPTPPGMPPQGMQGQLPQGQPPSGPLPEGAAQAGMGQGLQAPQIPPEQPTSVPMPVA